MNRWLKFAALMVALALTLSACSSGDDAFQEGASASLPSPPLELEQQIWGDSSGAVAREVTLYRASDGSMELTTVTRLIQPGPDGNLLRSALEELLGALPTGGSLLLGGAQATLEDVEFGSGVATVRLSVDACVNRSNQEFLLLCTSIANTLLGIDGVEAVNVLVGERSNSVCGLPMGAFTAPVDNVPAAYAQMQSESERIPEEGAAQLERAACLYFPAYGGQYLLPEVRNLSFSRDGYASTLIDALCGGPQQRGCCFSAVPANLVLLEGEPRLSVTADGERVLDLELSSDLSNYLALAGIEPWQLYGSLVLTLTSFLPELDAVRITIDGECVTACDLGGRPAAFPDGRMRRSDFSPFIGGSAWLYFGDAQGGLVRVECAVSQAGALSAGSVLRAMLTLGDSYLPGLHSIFPGGIGAEDLLGVALDGRTATVNLSANFYAQCQSLDPAGERRLVYGMVNALTELNGIGAVRFLVEGRQVDSLVGGIYLRTALFPDPGLAGAGEPADAPPDT